MKRNTNLEFLAAGFSVFLGDPKYNPFGGGKRSTVSKNKVHYIMGGYCFETEFLTPYSCRFTVAKDGKEIKELVSIPYTGKSEIPNWIEFLEESFKRIRQRFATNKP